MERGSECVVFHTVDQAQDDEEKQRDPAKPGKSNEGRENSAWLILLAPAEVAPERLRKGHVNDREAFEHKRRHTVDIAAPTIHRRNRTALPRSSPANVFKIPSCLRFAILRAL